MVVGSDGDTHISAAEHALISLLALNGLRVSSTVLRAGPVRPDTDDKRRAIVRADSPDSRSASRTTLRSPR